MTKPSKRKPKRVSFEAVVINEGAFNTFSFVQPGWGRLIADRY